jgi:RHS repeat-associated protein
LDNETGSWTLSWDAENRLSQAVRSVTDGETTTITKLEFQYDYQSRRVEKSKSESTNDGTTWTLLSARRFLYDGWTLIAEFDAASGTPALDRTHLWGTDLSGTLEDAGGIGGLLRTRIYDTTGSADYYPTYDANGNVSEYVDSSGTVVAHYEYSPFGKTTAATGDEADTFAFRFSTKYLDSETALYYYGYRYYDPEDGRWLSRDPLGEMGGANIRAFVTNNAYDLYDSLGEDVRVTGKGRNSKKTEKEILHVVDTQVIPRLESILKSPDLDHKNRKKLEKMLETLKDRPIPEPKIRTRKELKKDFKNNREAMKRAHIEDRANHKAWEEKESARESKCTRLLISDDITVDLADFAANQPYVRMNWKQVKSLDDNLKDGEPFSTSSVVFHELVEQYLKVNRGVKVYKIAHAEAVDLEGIFSGWKRLEEFSDGINTMTNDNKGMVPYRKGKMGIEVHIEICGGKVKIDRKPVTIPPKEE